MTEAAKQPDIRSLNIYQKLAAITADIGVVEKGGKNQEQKYNFIEYAAVAGKLRTLFGKYGVIMVPRMAKFADQERKEITSKYGAKGLAVMIDFEFDVINADKPDDKFTVTWSGEAADYGDKATNKAATSAIKYYQMRQFNISEQGDDPDHESPDLGTHNPGNVVNVQPGVTYVNGSKIVRASIKAGPSELTAEDEPDAANTTQVSKPARPVDRARITAFLRASGVQDDDMVEVLKKQYHVVEPAKMTEDEARHVLGVLEAKRTADGEVAA